MAGYEWLLFDVGNVLVRVTDAGTRSLAAAIGVDAAALRRYCIEAGLQEKATLGTISPEGYAGAVNARFGCSLTAEVVVRHVALDVATEIPGAHDILRRLRPHYRLAALSDTFFGHWEGFRESVMAAEFERLFCSYELGTVKTDPRTFPRVAALLNVDPAGILFVDDVEANVKSAEQAGLATLHAPTPLELHNGLVSAGLLR